MKSLRIGQWSFFFGALVVCAAVSLLASTSSSVAATPKHGGAVETARTRPDGAIAVSPPAITAPPPAVAYLGSMLVEGRRIVDLGSMTVSAKRVRWV